MNYEISNITGISDLRIRFPNPSDPKESSIWILMEMTEYRQQKTTYMQIHKDLSNYFPIIPQPKIFLQDFLTRNRANEITL